VRQEDSSTVILRSYRSGRLPNWYLERCKIWEAARATSAASTFFDPIQIGDTKFVDGGVRNNNPINLVDKEARNLWPNDEIFILSVGTGDAPGGSFEGSLKTVVDRLKDIATDTEQTNETFFNQHQPMMRNNLLFRFNVPGLGEIGLDESQQKPTIISRTQSYVERMDTLEKAANCIQTLCRDLVETEDDVEGI
jgi:predicted acylesterase/phospholipase RssA